LLKSNISNTSLLSRWSGLRAVDLVHRLCAEAADVSRAEERWLGDDRRGRQDLPHLEEPSDELSIAGYVETVRGRHGGLRLAKPAEEIGLGDIVRLTEPDMALVPCFKPGDMSCAIVKCCRLKGVLAKAQSAFVDVIDGYTLADLTKPRRRMQGALSLQSADGARAP
jgi:Rrf2 family nitric oxide-sensitive transcriptional repressor